MEVYVLLCFAILHLHALHGLPAAPDSEESTSIARRDGHGISPAQGEEGASRSPRRIIRKIHAGVAFLAGVKVGTLLASKGFDAGQGTLATTNNFQLFGKPVSSAISLAYGGSSGKLPLLDDPALNDTDSSSPAKKVATPKEGEGEDIVHVTLVRNPSPDTVDKLRRISRVTVAVTNGTVAVADDLVAQVESGGGPATPLPDSPDHGAFIRQHNRRVAEFNNEMRRRNSKF